ncbi:DUF4011 domain-containing protein [Methyloligella sp. 2.7D]|uniref:DUF4011 domain-containing protein n=1 Tax=unclassified Methyloligella TaxID=2625955 RepID=UPI001ABBA13A|nr:DUF4011 domain-containing protein [Methyloligella sp. GL2]
MQASSATPSWWYVENGQTKGPFDSQAIQGLLLDGLLGPDSLIWREGMSGWQSVREVEELARVLEQSSKQEPPEDGILNRLLDDARRRLVETGTRNRLIHINRENSRANALNIINERSDDIFQILRSGGKRMSFMATRRDETPVDNDVPLLETVVDNRKPFDEARYTDSKLETPLGPDALQKRLLRLARDARTAEEEQGINILFLALGFLGWFEDETSNLKREAPLILIPVELVRNSRTSTYDLRCRDDDIVANLPLQERLSGDFGIDLPEIEVDEQDWSPSSYFDRVEEVIAHQTRWTIDRDGMQLGFFSFAKLLMFRDLHPAAWGEGGLAASEIVKGLLRTGFEAETPLFPKETRLDEILEPADIIQVVDADASQTKVIEEVRAGRNLVVQGPPGTGKSQTITNIIAAAVHDGKTVLFVAEKMAALSVVHDRLKKANLSSTCLELHSRSANKKKFLGEIERTLNDGRTVPGMPRDPEALRQFRDQLNAIERRLHQTIPGTDTTPFGSMAIMSRLAGLGAPPPKLHQSELAHLTRRDLDGVVSRVAAFGQLKTEVGVPEQHPFFGVGNLQLQPLDMQRVGVKIGDAISHIEAITDGSRQIAGWLRLRHGSFDECQVLLNVLELIAAAPETAESSLHVVAAVAEKARFDRALQLGADWASSKAMASQFLEAAWQAPVAHLRSSVAKGAGSFFARLGPSYRSACRELATLVKAPLPKDARKRLALIDQLISLQEKRQRFQSEYIFLQQSLGGLWLQEDSAFTELREVSVWYEKVVNACGDINPNRLEEWAASSASCTNWANWLRPSLLGAKAELSEIEQTLAISSRQVFGAQSSSGARFQDILNRLVAIKNEQPRYSQWCQYRRGASELSKSGLGELVKRIDKGELTPAAAKNELKLAYAEAVWRRALQEFPDLDSIAQTDRHKIVQAFGRSEVTRLQDVQQLIQAKHLSQLPTGAAGQMAVIRGEIAKRKRHKPIRKLFSSAGSALQKIKPVLLMSPISVAQFLPPKSVEFDLLVIDEASQVRPEDALGACARAKQIVVVGDQKQLPPTSFFDRLTGNDLDGDDDEEEEVLRGAARAAEMESILTLCEARSVSGRMLEWHYRSRDPSLIAVSNSEFYRGGLVLPPSPLQDDRDYGLRLVQVPGVYTSRSRGSGRPGTNRIEAEEIVSAIARHASEHQDLSLGIATFSANQRNMVTELLELERRKNVRLDDFLREGKTEDVFVKNIENVQGDERDVILISVGYGPFQPGGRLPSMNFGPVNLDGGERRLNVLFSRARVRCDVFVSFDPGDIDLSRTTKNGPRILKRYLQYAKTGRLDEQIPTGRGPDSPFEEDVAAVIRRLGYDVDHQVGSAGFLIDLGVKHPRRSGQYMVAVECDGATYHSALWARERDRMRQEVLEHLGWHFHRIWSTDWFHRRESEIERLKQALDQVTRSTHGGIDIEGANQGWASVAELPDEDDDGAGEVAIVTPRAPSDVELSRY